LGHISKIEDDVTNQPIMDAVLRRPDRLYDGYIFDLDGTLLLGDALLPGARRLIDGLIALDRRIIYVTNNPTKRPEDVVKRLVRDGIPAAPENVINTISTTIHWLKSHEPDAVVFPIAETPLIEALANANIRTSEDPAAIDIILASYDRTFTYRKLQIAFDAVHLHGRAGGNGEPDAAAIVGAVEGCTGIHLERHFGKPDVVMLQTAMDRLNLHARDCLMVGDRLTTDIRMAINAGMPSALPLTGETTLAMLTRTANADHPTFTVQQVDHILPDAVWQTLGE
jgi:HAD superfamily hydrolase (TIGR01450 family)